MTQQDFIQLVQSQSKIQLSEYFCTQLNDFIKTASEQELAECASRIIKSQKRFINDSDFLEIVKLTLWQQASRQAQKSRIEKYKGSRWEEQHLLAMYFYREYARERGLAWIL